MDSIMKSLKFRIVKRRKLTYLPKKFHRIRTLYGQSVVGPEAVLEPWIFFSETKRKSVQRNFNPLVGYKFVLHCFFCKNELLLKNKKRQFFQLSFLSSSLFSSSEKAETIIETIIKNPNRIESTIYQLKKLYIQRKGTVNKINTYK